MTRVCYVAAPVSGDLDGNIARAKEWYAWLVEREPDVTFVMSWLVDVVTGNDLDPDRRERGLRDCEVIAGRCDGIVLVGGRRSVGMLRELAACRDAGGWVADLTALGKSPPESWDIDQSPLEVGLDAWRQP